MRSATSRFIPPLFDWIPDISGAPARRQVSIGLVASIVVHFLLLLSGAWLSGLLPERIARLVPAEPKVAEIELTIVPPPPKLEPEPAMEAARKVYLDSTGLAEATEAPKGATIESDKNMQAASESAPTGDAPLPSQDGLSRPTPNFTTQDYTLGKGEAKPLAQEPPQPPAPALYKPQPIAKENIDPLTQEPRRDQPTPEPATATPPTLPQIAEMNAIAQRALDKLKQVMEADDEDIALTTKPMVTPPKELTEAPPERPRPQPIAQPEPAALPKAPRQEVAMLTTPAPRAPQSGFQKQLQKTRIEGSISNRGKAAVDAERTPLAVYTKEVNAAIGSRWYYYLRSRMDLIAKGSVRINFFVDDRGRTIDIRVESNTGNQSLADASEQAIREAEIAPPPEELITPMKDRRLESTLTFTFY
jgi:TonB family protein